MEKSVALVVVRTWAVAGHNLALGIEIAGVKKLVVFVAELAAWREVTPNVVQIAEALREGYVGVVVEASLAEDGETILG